MANIDYSFVVDVIKLGQADNMLDLIIDAAVSRRKFLREMKGAANRATMMPGTKVRIAGDIKPRYLIGIRGVVSTEPPNRRGDIMVDIDPSYYHRLGRYSRKLGVPASCVEAV